MVPESLSFPIPPPLEVSEMASAKKHGVRNRVRIDDVGSILKFRIGFSFGECLTPLVAERAFPTRRGPFSYQGVSTRGVRHSPVSFGESSAGFCRSVWLPESILNFHIGPVASIGG